MDKLDWNEVDAVFGVDGELELPVIYILLALLRVFCSSNLVVNLVNDGAHVGLVVLGLAQLVEVVDDLLISVQIGSKPLDALVAFAH